MLTLFELQQQFIKNLTYPEDNFLNFIQSHARLTSQQHLSIYQSSIVGVLQKTLKETYPVCCKLVGSSFFINMMNEYINKTFSISPDLEEYGANFNDFIAEFEPAKSIAYLPDIARLEWAWNKLFNAKKTTTLNFEKLAVDYETWGENILFILPPESSLITSSFPLHLIWEMNQDDYHGDHALILNPNETYFFLIWKDASVMRIEILAYPEWQLLSWMQQGLTMGKIAENSEVLFPELDFSAVFTQFVGQGWICDYRC